MNLLSLFHVYHYEMIDFETIHIEYIYVYCTQKYDILCVSSSLTIYKSITTFKDIP